MAMSASPAEASGTSKTIVAQDYISQRAASLTSVPTGQETPRFSSTKPSGLKTAKSNCDWGLLQGRPIVAITSDAARHPSYRYVWSSGNARGCSSVARNFTAVTMKEKFGICFRRALLLIKEKEKLCDAGFSSDVMLWAVRCTCTVYRPYGQVRNSVNA